MHTERFDAAIRFMARTHSRRGIARAVLGSTLAALFGGLGVPAASAKCAKAGASCRKKKGKKPKCCAGTTCQGGRCRCPEGQIACGGVCLSPWLDEQNCGQCGKVCPSGQRCNSGNCCKPSGATDPVIPCCYGYSCNPPGQNCKCIS